MLTFEPVMPLHAAKLREYYKNGTYRLCEYSAGIKVMWRDQLHPAFAEAAGCLIVRNNINGRYQFDYPVAGADGDEEAALTAIENWCTATGSRPVLSVVPEEKAGVLLQRYPRFHFVNERTWKDYLYRAEDLKYFAGRHYSGQRNHINKFRREYPTARYIPLQAEDKPLIEQFWADYESEFQKDSAGARRELSLAKELVTLLDTGCFCAGGLLVEGRLAALSLGEICGETLIVHVEKALYSYAGVYPAMVQSFVTEMMERCPELRWVNREDDAGDKGLRTSKLQYLPTQLGSKLCFVVESELDRLQRQPKLRTERLTLDGLREGDKPAYNALCLDDERNRWWGYDYRKDLQGELTEDYFLQVVREDFAARRAVNFAVRLQGKCIGEAVLYAPDWRGGAELGCRIAPQWAGNGYGTEAFAAVAEWALYRLGLTCVKAKCYKENKASYRMLSSCMRRSGEDDTFYYFEKQV